VHVFISNLINQDQTMLLPTGFYAGPPFGRAVAFYHPGLRPPLRGRGILVGLCSAGLGLM